MIKFSKTGLSFIIFPLKLSERQYHDAQQPYHIQTNITVAPSFRRVPRALYLRLRSSEPSFDGGFRHNERHGAAVRTMRYFGTSHKTVNKGFKLLVRVQIACLYRRLAG